MLEKSVSGGEGLRAPVQVGARGPRSEIYDLALPASKDPYKALDLYVVSEIVSRVFRGVCV